ncbi:MAG TPA: metallophosphoesterase family protein [Chloroflexia bacterium]|nr:metallophosphoesterase family protein [Chloroflexia bacterium]
MRYGLVSDIHSNLTALEAVLHDIEQHGPVDGILCMGDIVGYGPLPNEVIQRLKEYNLFTIKGNHDMAVLGELPLSDFNRDAIDANVWTRTQLTQENLDWLESLKPMAVFNEKVTLAHGSPSEPVWEYLTTPHSAARNFESFDTQLCFVGHTHLPRSFRLKDSELEVALAGAFNLPRSEMRIPDEGETIELGENRYIINPGSVGQPRDGDRRAAYAVFDSENLTVTFGRASYDVAATQEMMRKAHLPDRLIMRLDYGL